MAEYKLPESYFTDIKNAGDLETKTSDAKFKADADQYDLIYSRLDQFIFPFLGETDEDRKPWIILVEAYFNRQKGGFWINRGGKQHVFTSKSVAGSGKWQNPNKPIPTIEVDPKKLSSYFTLVNDNIIQGGSSIDSKKQFNDLSKDMAALLEQAPGIKDDIVGLMVYSYPKWKVSQSEKISVSNDILAADFNSLYSQMLGKLIDLYKNNKDQKGLYEKNGATLGRVIELEKDGSLKKMTDALLQQGTDNKDGVNNSEILNRKKAGFFSVPIFIKYFVERFAFEEPDISEVIKPSEFLQKLAGTSPASPGSPSTKDVLNQQSQTPAPGGEKIGVKTNEPKPPTAESPGPEVAETASEPAEKTQAKTETAEPGEAAVGKTQAGSSAPTAQSGASKFNSFANSITNAITNITTGTIVNQQFSAAASPESQLANLYVNLKDGGFIKSTKLKTEFLKLEKETQQQLAKEYSENPAALSSIISTVMNRTQQTETEKVKEVDKQTLLQLETDRNAVNSAKSNESKSVESVQTSLSSSSEIIKAEVEGAKKASSEKTEDAGNDSQLRELTRMESNKMIRKTQTNQILNPPNQTVEAIKGMNQTIQNTSEASSNQIKTAITNIANRTTEPSVSNTSSVSNNTTNINKTDQMEREQTGEKPEMKTEQADTSLSDFYLHAIYDALVGQGIKIRTS